MTRDTEELTERAPSLDRDERAAYRVVSSDWDVTTTIVKAVTEVAECDLLAGDPVLYDVIDPDALSQLFTSKSDDGSGMVGKVVFELRGCRVEVHADGEHIVYEPVETPEESRTSTVKSV